MKTKNKTALLIIICTTMLIGFNACKKYPDGPILSFHSRTERVANTWKVDNYKVNDVDYTSLVSDYVETYTKDGNYSFSWGNVAGTGKWEFQNNDAEIRITGISNKSSETLYILKLEEKEFWYYYID
ncbi:MAG TPA: hypothetical protein VFJ43_15645, partial [Bacteroidia bacterium]|nr:hypothetical protein [Bacteroidia bacterium]